MARPLPVITSIESAFDQARLATRALYEFGQSIVNPTIRLGVTGLSRAGKTVFITALVHGLVRGGRFPIFEAYADGRIAGARLAPQPDDAIPRFDYEEHVRALVEERRWPESTRRISELRVVIDYQSRNGAERSLTLDIVDYPGEWLLDLPLLNLIYGQWSADSVARSRAGLRAGAGAAWQRALAAADPSSPADENTAIELAREFTSYLRLCRDDRYAMSTLAPGRFLMPGDLENSPALTFAPLDVPRDGEPPQGSLWAMMQRRYEAYKAVVVRPFYNEHFLRLDRQIVLMDALAAFNAGDDAIRDLQSALGGILDCFRVGRRTLVSALLRPRADRILFAATKADHLHRSDHDRLEAILKRMTERTGNRAMALGAEIDIVALAAVRATREAQVSRGGETLPSILGVVAAGEASGTRVFDGETEVAVFPGDLPADPDALLRAGNEKRATAQSDKMRFLRFRPPGLELNDDGVPVLPHIRLDRAMQFLFGDRLQ